MISINRFVLLIVLVYCFNFLGVGVYAPLLLIPKVIRLLMKKHFDRSFLFSMLCIVVANTVFSFTSLFYNDYTYGDLVLILLFPFAMYLVGYDSDYKALSNKEVLSLSFINIRLIFMALTFYILLSYMKTIYIYGNVENTTVALMGRNILNFWNNTEISTTGMSTILAPCLGIFPLLFIKSKSLSIISKIVIAFSFLASSYVTMAMGSRTSILIIIVSGIVALLFLVIKKKHKVRILTLSAIIAIIFFWIVNHSDLLVLKRFSEGTGENDVRFTVWKYTLQNFTHLIVGGRTIILPNNVKFVHNMWLDILYDVGVVPFLFAILFSILNLILILKLIKQDNVSILTKLTFLLIFVSYSMSFMLEPVYNGWLPSFVLYCFFMGMAYKVYFLSKRNLKEVKREEGFHDKLSNSSGSI
ncbi:O-antigen ligase family protein [Loigolactobacillus coryniformis]|uniref:O-antigen ligase family protein n=1 Tax=Loigolactobacillus coryniformis TaxID=1610 RepID=UPI00345D71B8